MAHIKNGVINIIPNGNSNQKLNSQIREIMQQQQD